MTLGGDMVPNMGTTINKIACSTNGRKLNSASYTLFKIPQSGSDWRFASARWGDLRKYYADFPWNDSCFRIGDPSVCAERITSDSVWQ
ncbi:hypothetical protein E2C01_011639 [Portunus trituberculatus]|uniref:Uncharacterized protein n=1 Tax=Portunus trituberculatus TaxID=210409 RepID=A0A5B7DBK7_PORTR|nr:hypothetical protein [Portunus trituberculatus]